MFKKQTMFLCTSCLFLDLDTFISILFSCNCCFLSEIIFFKIKSLTSTCTTFYLASRDFPFNSLLTSSKSFRHFLSTTKVVFQLHACGTREPSWCLTLYLKITICLSVSSAGNLYVKDFVFSKISISLHSSLMAYSFLFIEAEMCLVFYTGLFIRFHC